MKRLMVWVLSLTLGLSVAVAQDKKKEDKEAAKMAVITFDKTTHDYGDFSEDDPVVSCKFTFTNTGEAPLVIHQAIASCGCTVPTYTRMPIKPGEKGAIEVTYNGHGKFPGRFKKSITVRTNAKEPMTRLIVSGNMKASEKKEPATNE